MTDIGTAQAGIRGSGVPACAGHATRPGAVLLPVTPAGQPIVPGRKPTTRPKRSKRPAGLLPIEAAAWDMPERPVLEGHVFKALKQVAHLVWAYHPNRSDRSQPGWPDWFMIGPALGNGQPHLMARELKAMGYDPTAEQTFVLNGMLTGGVDTGVWTPLDWLTGRVTREIAMLAYGRDR